MNRLTPGGRYKTDVRGCEIQLQMDNCGRENKNNSLCRLAGILTGSGRCYRMQLNFLESGHSHEDIDQYFSSLSNLIESRREIHTPDQFVAVLDPMKSLDLCTKSMQSGIGNLDPEAMLTA